MVMDAERGDEEVNFLQRLGPGRNPPISVALLGKSILVGKPIVLHGQREFRGPQPHLVKALGPSSGVVRLGVFRAFAQCPGPVPLFPYSKEKAVSSPRLL